MLVTPQKNCLQCGHVLRGRVDKKFCSDSCRNSFNNEQNSSQYAIVRQVNALLLRNRRILSGLLGEAPSIRITREQALLRGFKFRYSTHEFTSNRGRTYHFCYEFGWRDLGSDKLHLLRRDS